MLFRLRLADEERLVRLQRKEQHRDVGEQKDDRNCERELLLIGCRPPAGSAFAVTWKTVGMISAAAPILIAVAETRAAVLLNLWCEKRRPPANADAPSTSNRLPMIDPVSDAFTTVVSPFESAISAIISSAALPKVALRNPPMPAPVCAAICCVARPNQPASRLLKNSPFCRG